MKLLKITVAKEIEPYHVSPVGRTGLILLVSTILWLVAIGVGLRFLRGYENAPGINAEPPTEWPAGSLIQRPQDHATLILLVHPHCPCTRATIGELSLLMAHTEGRLTAYVLFLKPAGVAEDWEKTDLWRSAAMIPGVNAIVDEGGAEARRFHSATSGQAILYNAAGHLLFSGGITGARGHSGDNAGRDAIASLVNEGTSDRTETAVFGCPLFNPNSECQSLKDESHRH